MKTINQYLLTDEQKDLMAKGHGRKIFKCGHMEQCRCKHGAKLPIQHIQDFCFHCKSNMKDWFDKRTALHIGLIQKYCNMLSKIVGDPELVERGKIHDQSKYQDPEIQPYILISWKYKCQDDGTEFKVPEDTETKLSQATNHHVTSNRHHPEYHSDRKVDLINREDRDKPPAKIVDATSMSDLDISEMVADWCAMSEEKGNSPREWADKNVNIRWKFTSHQTELIYTLINKAWKYESH